MTDNAISAIVNVSPLISSSLPLFSPFLLVLICNVPHRLAVLAFSVWHHCEGCEHFRRWCLSYGRISPGQDFKGVAHSGSGLLSFFLVHNHRQPLSCLPYYAGLKSL